MSIQWAGPLLVESVKQKQQIEKRRKKESLLYVAKERTTT